MKKTTAVLRLSVLASAIALIAGCGGGGGGSGDTAAAPAPAGGAVGGVAAKGFLKSAKVTAYCGNSEAAADQLDSKSTDTAGAYSLKWTSACVKPVKLVVTADATTTMADEATGKDVAPPAGFKLRALVADPSTTATKNITPFTDMAAAVAGTSATLTKTGAANAELAIVNTVLGGDIGAYQAKPVAPTAAALATASADEKKLATLLTAVSAFAQDDATCKTKTTTGDQIKCATDTLAAQAVATVTGVSDSGYTVATTVPANTPATMLATTLTDLTAGKITGVTATGTQALSTDITSDTSGAGTLLTAATSKVTTAATSGGTVTIAAGASSGIQAARDLFNSLKTDILALSNSNGNGFLDQKLSAAQADWATNGHASVTSFLDYMKAIDRATQMASDAKTWAAPPTSGLVANAAYPVAGHSDLVLITDSTGAASQFIRYFASFIGPDNQPLAMNCRVNVSDMSLGKAGCSYGYGKANVTNTGTAAGSFTTYFHRVRVALGTTSGSYGWLDSYASRVYSSTQRYVTPNGTVFIPVLQTISTPQGPQTITSQASFANQFVPLADAVDDATALTGTATLTQDASGNLTALSLKGDIQPLATGQDKSTLDISAAMTSTSTSQTANITGTLTNVQGTATTLTMKLATGSQIVGTTGANGQPVSANLISQIKTTGFQYDGTLAMDTFTAELNGSFQPANASFIGKVSTLANGTATEFLSGTLGLKQTNLAAFDPTKPTSASNFLKQTASFTGTVTNGATAYVLTLIGDGSTFGQESVTLNYTRNGTQMVSVTGTTSASTTTLTISGSGSVNATLTNGSGDVKTGTTKVGTITQHPSQVNFTDGTYLLLGV